MHIYKKHKTCTCISHLYNNCVKFDIRNVFNDSFYRLEHQMMFTKKMQYLLYTCVSINNCFMSIGPRLLFSIFD